MQLESLLRKEKAYINSMQICRQILWVQAHLNMVQKSVEMCVRVHILASLGGKTDVKFSAPKTK